MSSDGSLRPLCPIPPSSPYSTLHQPFDPSTKYPTSTQEAGNALVTPLRTGSSYRKPRPSRCVSCLTRSTNGRCCAPPPPAAETVPDVRRRCLNYLTF
ncbi:hypothetical protein EVAR_8_1 [Eumeta japonica]|uniref:Uncharacterized protein n=1 Tax=Eumeta variegata TaxID=151549 RepID=A0A4C1SAS1_EUMVA|nr:hypothetical protein EVAR_8_1 [Eumeta japonica]